MAWATSDNNEADLESKASCVHNYGTFVFTGNFEFFIEFELRILMLNPWGTLIHAKMLVVLGSPKGRRCGEAIWVAVNIPSSKKRECCKNHGAAS